MNRVFFLVCSFLLLILKVQSQTNLYSFKLDVSIDTIKKCYCKDEIKIIISSSNIIDGLKCKINGFDFLVGIDNNMKIIYYSTRDSNFLINDFKYLTKNKGVIDSIRRDSIFYDPSSGAYIKLEEEWNLGFEWKDVFYEKGKMVLREYALPITLFKRSENYNSSARWTRKLKGKRTTLN